MSNSQPISAADFGAAFKGFLEQSVAQAPASEPVFVHRLREHFGAKPSSPPIIRISKWRSMRISTTPGGPPR